MKKVVFVVVMGIVFTFCGIATVFSDESNVDKQDYVGTQQFYALGDASWVTDCLNLNSDINKLGVKIVAYRIQWFGGDWSGWYVPGVNDLYKKSGEPLRRFWACFNDHSFEIIYMAPKKVEWQIKQQKAEKKNSY